MTECEEKEIQILVRLDDGTETTLRLTTKLPEYTIEAGSATLSYLLRKLFPSLKIEKVLAVTGPHGIDTKLYEELCSLSITLDDKLDTVANPALREALGQMKLYLDLVLKIMTS